MIIAIGYKSKVGKSYVAKIMSKRYGLKIAHISLPAYRSCCMLFGIKYNDFGKAVQMDTATYRRFGKTPHEILSEYIKAINEIAPNIFTELAHRCLEALLKDTSSDYVVPDIKRLYEAKIFKEAGAIMIEVIRQTDTTEPVSKYSGNEMLFNWDYKIYNNFNVDYVTSQIDEIMSQLGIDKRQDASQITMKLK